MKDITLTDIKRYFEEFPKALVVIADWAMSRHLFQAHLDDEEERHERIYTTRYVWMLSEVAPLLGVHPHTILRHKELAKLTDRRLPGGQHVFLREDIDALRTSIEKGHYAK